MVLKYGNYLNPCVYHSHPRHLYLMSLGFRVSGLRQAKRLMERAIVLSDKLLGLFNDLVSWLWLWGFGALGLRVPALQAPGPASLPCLNCQTSKSHALQTSRSKNPEACAIGRVHVVVGGRDPGVRPPLRPGSPKL